MAKKHTLTKSDYLPYPEFKRLLECLHKNGEYKLELYAILGFCTACRVSDVLAFKWRDILNVSKLTVVEQKTKKTRQIPFNKDTQEKIHNLYALQGKPNSNYFVFANNYDNGEKPISPQYLNRKLKEIKEKYNLQIDHFSTHTFRKTFGRYVYEENNRSAESLILLNSIFKHTSIQITKTYIGLTQDEINEVFGSISF